MVASPSYVVHISGRTCNLYHAQTDEQAPLPDALSQLLDRVRLGYSQAGDFIFNCQMGRGRTTTGMVTACLISTIMHWVGEDKIDSPEEGEVDSYDGPSEEEAYLQGTVASMFPPSH